MKGGKESPTRITLRLLFLIWCALGVYSLVQHVVFSATLGRRVAWIPVIAVFFSGVLVWAGLGYLMQDILFRWRLSGPGWRVNLLKTLVLGLAVAPLHRTLNLLITSLAIYFQAPERGPWSYLGGAQILSGSFDSLLNFVVIAGAYNGWEYYREARLQRLRASELANQLSHARLDSLKAQLQPHFLFNCLNTISALMEEDVGKAQSVMTRLGDLLRRSLDTPPEESLPLESEIEFLEQYLSLEKARFEDRLQLKLDLAPQALQARVPPFMLQPLVENAVRHAVSHRDPGRVSMRARLEGGKVLIEIEDNGPGLPSGEQHFSSEGIGLSNTRKRLKQFFGEECLEFENSSAGLIARIRIPFRES